MSKARKVELVLLFQIAAITASTASFLGKKTPFGLRNLFLWTFKNFIPFLTKTLKETASFVLLASRHDQPNLPSPPEAMQHQPFCLVSDLDKLMEK